MERAMVERLYRIGDAAELLGLKTYVLRYWETEFPQIQPVRTGKGQRRYTEKDMVMLGRIRYLLHDQGMTIEGVRRMLAGASALHLAEELPAGDDAVTRQDDMAVETPPLAFAGSSASEQKKTRGRLVQLPLDACFAPLLERERPVAAPSSPARTETRAGAAQPASPVPEAKHDERVAWTGSAIRHIADELRALRRLLREE